MSEPTEKPTPPEPKRSSRVASSSRLGTSPLSAKNASPATMLSRRSSVASQGRRRSSAAGSAGFGRADIISQVDGLYGLNFDDFNFEADFQTPFEADFQTDFPEDPDSQQYTQPSRLGVELPEDAGLDGKPLSLPVNGGGEGYHHADGNAAPRFDGLIDPQLVDYNGQSGEDIIEESHYMLNQPQFALPSIEFTKDEFPQLQAQQAWDSPTDEWGSHNPQTPQLPVHLQSVPGYDMYTNGRPYQDMAQPIQYDQWWDTEYYGNRIPQPEEVRPIPANYDESLAAYHNYYGYRGYQQSQGNYPDPDQSLFIPENEQETPFARVGRRQWHQAQVHDPNWSAGSTRPNDSGRRRSRRNTRSASPYSSPEAPQQSHKPDKRASVYQEVFKPQKPKRNEKTPWVRTNNTTKGESTRTGKINDFVADGYTDCPHPVGDWVSPVTKYPFTYAPKQYLKENTYPTHVIEDFIFNYPTNRQTGAKLTLWIQKSPTDNARRYKSQEHSRCLFKDCPARRYEAGAIVHGHYRVAFDEHWHKYHGLVDPFQTAGYAHLYCMERFLDFETVCRLGNVKADNRSMPKEAKGRFQGTLNGQPEYQIAANFVDGAKKGYLRELEEFKNYPEHRRHRGKPKPHKETLVYHMCVAKELSRPPAQMKQFSERGLGPSHIIVNRGDLEVMYMKKSKRLKAKRKEMEKRRKAGEIVNENEDEELVQALLEDVHRRVAEAIAMKKSRKTPTSRKRKATKDVDSDDEGDQPKRKRNKCTKRKTARHGSDSDNDSDDPGRYGDDSDTDDDAPVRSRPISQPVRKSARLQGTPRPSYNNDSPTYPQYHQNPFPQVGGKYPPPNPQYINPQFTQQYGGKHPAPNPDYAQGPSRQVPDSFTHDSQPIRQRYSESPSPVPNNIGYGIEVPLDADGLPVYNFHAATPGPDQQDFQFDFLNRRHSSIAIRPRGRGSVAAFKEPLRSARTPQYPPPRYATRSSSRSPPHSARSPAFASPRYATRSSSGSPPHSAPLPHPSPRKSVSIGDVEARTYNPAESLRLGMQCSSLSSGAQSGGV